MLSEGWPNKPLADGKSETTRRNRVQPDSASKVLGESSQNGYNELNIPSKRLMDMNPQVNDVHQRVPIENCSQIADTSR